MAWPLARGNAQHAQEILVVGPAIDFIKTELPVGPIVIDADYLKGNPEAASAIARAMGARVARLSDVAQCTGSAATRRTCTLPGVAAVVSFNRPVFDGKTARVKVNWWFATAAGSIAQRWVALTLEQGPGGRWIVKTVDLRGMS
jgi:hypothetical protein